MLNFESNHYDPHECAEKAIITYNYETYDYFTEY